MADAPDQNSPENNSIEKLYMTLGPAAAIAAAYLLVFLILRKSHKRFYAPRTYLGTLREQERSPALPEGFFGWIGAAMRIPDTYALQHQSLDAYLYLRFLKMTVVIFGVGVAITWPILFPIYITGGGTGTGLDMLSMSNIDRERTGGKYRYFGSVGAAVLFFGFILALITRESIFYINLRQAFLLSPTYANRISSRTVLFTSVPAPYLDEHKLRKVFGEAVRRVWITGDTEQVDEVVEERDEVAMRLEGAEVKLIKLANKERNKAIKAGHANPGDDQAVVAGDAEGGSIAARWIPATKRPTHKLGKFGLYGEKVDSINWCRDRLATLIPEADRLQAAYRAGDNKRVGGVFIEFATQADAQVAFQTLSHHQALHMAPRYIGVSPSEVVWKSQSITWWHLVIRRILVVAFITAMIVFWAIPVAVVGLISSISFLTKVPFLTWLNKIPAPILGLIGGFLPPVALSILMMLVPIIMRLCAKLAGEPSLARVELFTQNAYFTFQVVQVFLVVTISTSVTALIDTARKEPEKIVTLLAEKIPTASNFFITYFILQGLTVAAQVISQVVGFIIFQLLYRFLANTPRKLYEKWSTLSAVSWGNLLPIYANIAVIGITYSCIAPLTLGFATIGMLLFYLAYRYNILFVSDAQIDTKGLIYPRALQHLMVGVYIAEVCLIGLFAINTTPGPLIIMIIFTIFTVLYHYSLQSALGPLLYQLPKTLVTEEDVFRLDIAEHTKNSSEAEKNGDASVVPAPHAKPNFITKFFKPHIFADYATLRRLVPHDLYDADNLYEQSVADNAYFPPNVTNETPLLWIPRDLAGVSTEEIRETSKVINITDEGATLDEKNKIQWDAEGSRPPLWTEKIYY